MFNSIAVVYFKEGDNAPKPGSLRTDSAIETRAKDVASATLEPETKWILNNLMVVEPTALLNATFGESAVKAVEASANLIGDAFEGQKTNWGLESEMYAPLTQAFNKWIAGIVPIRTEDDYFPTSSLACLNTATSRYSLAPEMAFTTKIGPDLCLTFDSERIQAGQAMPCDTANVLVEVKLDINTDISIGSKGSGSDVSKERKKLMQQLFGYVAYGQWPSLPYRFSWTISISNNTLRIWRWSSSGVIVTAPIYYLSNPSPIAQFVQLLAAGPYSRLGLDIGVGMTFSSVATLELSSALQGVIKKYSEACGESVAMTRWVGKAEKAKLLVFNPTQVDGQPSKCGPILVVSHPISSTVGIFCRATRCYLAIRANPDEGASSKEIHVLKLSWQYTTRIPESDFFEMAKNRSSNGTIPHLATVLAAGDVKSTKQRLGVFQAHSSGPTTPNDKEMTKDYKLHTLGRSEDDSQVVSSHPRILRWIVFKEAGIRLNSFRNVREMLQAFLDAVTAHRSLCDIGILHQDISEGNVLMDLGNARRGMLIDLDMADDVQKVLPENQEPPTLPAMTGTLRFTSLALQRRPVHRSWHDLESFFWLLVYMSLKHVPDIVYEEFDRINALKLVFPDGAHPSTVIADAKRNFLNQPGIKSIENYALQSLLDDFRRVFGALHTVLQLAYVCWQRWRSLAKFIDLPNQSRLLLMPYAVESLADLSQYLDDNHAALGELTKRQYAPGLTVTVKQHLRSLKGDIDQWAQFMHIKHFPTHEYILAKIRDALLDDSELNPDSPSFDYEALLNVEVVQSRRSPSSSPRVGSMGPFGRPASVSIPMPTISEVYHTRARSTSSARKTTAPKKVTTVTGDISEEATATTARPKASTSKTGSPKD